MWRCLIDFSPVLYCTPEAHWNSLLLNVVFFLYIFFYNAILFFNGRERNHCLNCNNEFMKKKIYSRETVYNSNSNNITGSQTVQGKLVPLLAFTTIFNWLQTFYPWVEW